MGTGSSRARKARRSPAARSWRGPARGSGSSSAPAGQGQAEEAAAAGGGGARCCSSDSSSRQTPVPPTSPSLGEPDSDLELLDQVLQEYNEAGRLGLPRYRPGRLDAGDSCSRPARGSAEEDGSHRDPLVFPVTSIQESNTFANELPLKKLESQARISYDYYEEELMATIEQEYSSFTGMSIEEVHYGAS